MKRTALALVILLTATIILASFFLFSSSALLRSIPPPSTPEGSAVPSAPNPTETPPTEAAPAPSESPSNSSSAPSLSTSPPLKPWPCSNQTPPDRTAQALAISSIYDPTGDLFSGSGAPINGPGHIDIVYAEILQIDSTLLQLSMKLAENIPNPYTQAYTWVIDTDEGANYHRDNSHIFNNDLGAPRRIFVGVDGLLAQAGHYGITVAAISGRAYSDEPSKYIPWSQVTISGNTITVTILLSDIGNPTSFWWVAGAGDTAFDKAPNSGHMTLNIV